MVDLLGAVKVGAVIVAIGVAGYLAVTNIGWESTLEFVGIQTTTLTSAPKSQCARAREQSTEDQSFICINDRKWLRAFYRACADGADPGLAFVGPDGAVTDVPKCPRRARAEARHMLTQPIPRDYRVADQIDALRGAQ